VTLWRNLLALTALPGLVAAADPEMMNLVMPDAAMVMEFNIGKIMASPIGSAMREAVHKGIATQLKGELAKAKPRFQEQIAVLGNIDWSQEVQDIVIAGGPGKHPPTLIVARSSFGPARIQALKAFTGGPIEYEGVPMLASAKPGDGVIAFLDNSIVVIGQMTDVEAAIRRRSQHTALPQALAAQVRKYSQDDIWVASTEILTAPVIPPSVTKSPAGAEMTQFIEKVAGLNGGLRFSPDFDFSADLEARTEKGAAEIAEGLRSLTGMLQLQAKNAGQGGRGLQGFKYQVNGKHILLSVHVPEGQMRAGLQQIRAAHAGQTAVAARQPAPAAAPASGLPAPPAGTMRVQSSDMGTVLIPVGKQQ
jgi:hypothetical protein